MRSNKSKKVFDLVCGMELYLKDAKYKVKHNGGYYYFCAKFCQKHFKNDPEKYAPGVL